MTNPPVLLQIEQVRAWVLRPSEILSPVEQATVDAYADVVGGEIDALDKEGVAITIKNTDTTNALKWKVLASIDGTTYVEAQAEASLSAAAIGSYSTTFAVYRYYKVQVKSSVGSTPAKATVHLIAK